MLIYIVRHGETNANKQGYLHGWSNDKLNENGKKLAEITGQAMKDIKFDYCISSPQSRAKETAEIILRESENDIDVMFDDRLKEINFGAYEHINIRDSEAVQFLTVPNVYRVFTFGESIKQVMYRTQDFLKRLIEKDDGKTYLLSTHGCALRCMLNYLYEDSSDFWHGHVPYNCAVNIVEAKGGIGTLITDDKIYYEQSMIIDRYKQ